MNTRAGFAFKSALGSFSAKHGVRGDDFGVSPEKKAVAVGAGVFGISAAVGYGMGRQHGIDNYTPTETVPVQRSYFVKTGTETYMGTCHGLTPSGESFSFSCPKVRDTGYYEYYTENVNAREHFALKGLGIGAAVGLVGGVLAGLATHAITRDFA